MLRFAGLDWATESKNRALVVLASKGGLLAVDEVRSKVRDAEVVELCRDCSIAVIGVDIPFGWPHAFAQFVSRWSPVTGTERPPHSEAFRFRLTDLIVRSEVPKEQLSVAADRIAMGARAWVQLIALHDLAKQVDVEGRVHEA